MSITNLRSTDPYSLKEQGDGDDPSDSEVSYKPLYTVDDVKGFITFLTFTTTWLCISTLSDVVLLSVILYKYIFLEDDNVYFIIIVVFCDLIILVDFVSMLGYIYNNQISKKKFVIRKNIVLFCLDAVSVTAIPSTLINSDSLALFYYNLITVGLRNYRLVRLFVVLSKTIGHNTISILAFKYSLIFFLVWHVYACMWMSISCFEWDEDCDPHTSWAKRLESINEYNTSSQKLLDYIMCMLYSTNTFTTVGMYGASEGNDAEQILTITLMLFGVYIASGLFIGDFSSVQQESYKRHSVFSHKLTLICNCLGRDAIIPKKLKEKIKNFYIIFWKKRSAINKSELFEKMLPDALQNRIIVDKYWGALNASNLLCNTSMPFKRAVALQFFTELYTTGDVIYAQDKMKDTLMYVSRGSVQVLSGDDTESSLLTLRVGSCLGDSSLVFSLESKVQVIASSYCVMFCLRKADLWKTAHKLKCLYPSIEIFSVAKRKMRVARIKLAYKENTSTKDSNLLTLISSPNISGLASRIASSVAKSSNDLKSDLKEEGNVVFNLYVISKEDAKFSDHDGIFIKTTFPWILRPNSSFTVAWETFFVITVMLVTCWYPWMLMRKIEHQQLPFVFKCFVCLGYTLDFILKVFTAIEDDKDIQTDVSELLAMHCSRLTFVFDVASAIPFEFNNSYTFLMLNRLFQLYRIVIFIKRVEYSFKVNVAMVRMMKYVVYLLTLSYAIGVIYFLSACRDKCEPNTWPSLYGMSDDQDTQNVFETSLMCAMLLISGTGGTILYKRLIEVFLITLFCVIGTLVFSYLVSDYSATLTLASTSQSIYIQMVQVVRNLLNEKEMPDTIKKRMDHYLEVQWLDNKGQSINELLKDAPRYLYEEYQTARYESFFNKVPLFQELDADVISKLAATSETLFFPPNEFVTYSREVVKEMYIIEKGFCEIISPASGRIENVIGEGAVFSAIDMVLELPGVFHVRTVTHVKIITITLASLKNALTAEGKVILHKLVEETKQSFTVQRLFTESSSLPIHKDVEVDVGSWVAAPKSVDHRRRAEYLNSWKVFRCCRYIMLPYTIMPCGRFLEFYEIFRAVCAFISALLIPTSFIYAYYFKRFWIIQVILDATAYFDLYLRLHVCFYNENGVLVTHPRATAVHYLGGSFLVDVIACFPIDCFLKFFWQKNFDSPAAFETMCNFMRLNRILQIYRIPDAFTILSRDTMKTVGTMTLSFKLIILSLALQNFLVGIFMIYTFTLKEYTEAIVPYPGSWFTFVEYPSLDMTAPINMYIISFYLVCAQAMGMGYGELLAFTRTEVILNIVIIICGYLWYTYVLVIISNNKSIVNITLTLYQNHMKQLIKFMNREKIQKSLQKKAINHFEYVWQRTHGLNTVEILHRCHLSLRKDCALYLYEDTLKEVVIFRDMVSSFYRVIGTNLEEQYYLTDYPIIRLNDIINKWYIVHRGKVEILGPDGSTFTTLTKGSVFGNIDDVKETRSMITAKAHSTVDVLVIDTQYLYSLVNTYQVVINRLRKHILLQNLSYIESKYNKDEDMELDAHLHYVAGKKYLSKKLKFLLSPYLSSSFMICSCLSFIVTSFQASFNNFTVWLFIAAYMLDVIHLVKIYLGLLTPYHDEQKGEIVIAKKKIVKHYLKSKKFFIEVIGCFPTDFLYFALASSHLYGLTLLRLNRVMRVINVYTYFHIKHDQLNINVFLINISKLLIIFALLIHTQGCIWYMLACPYAVECLSESWVFMDDKRFCETPYVCALYTATSVATYSGFTPPHATTTTEILYVCLTIVFNKFTLAVFIGYMTAMVHNLNAMLVNFDHGMEKLKEYLKHSRTSFPLVQKVLTYASQLWNRSEGMQIPQYLTACPSFLMENIKIGAYGHHIYMNEIFMRCHPDFLRMLISLLNVTTLFDGNYVCQQGDVNDTMYFVHQGIILVCKESEAEEVLVDELAEMDTFGTIQGIVKRTPHTHTFMSRNVSVVLSLKLSEWEHLLNFFPASKYTIYHKIQTIWNRGDQ